MVKKASSSKTKPIKKRSSPKKNSNQKNRQGEATRARNIKTRIASYLGRRPHRSFQRTRRRDYVRSLMLPGFMSFTKYTLQTLLIHKKTFGLLILFYSLATALLAGVASQSAFLQLTDTLNQTSGNILHGGWGELGKAGLLFASGVSGNFSAQTSEAQQIYAGLIGVFSWLTVVWLLRNQLAGHAPKLRDAVYNAGSPIIGTISVALLLVIQLIPMAVAAVGYNAAINTGFLSNGAISMLFFIVAALLVVLSLYLVTSTFFALIVVTLPGMYPWQAIRTAGDLVIGRRVRILLRLLWMALVVVISWVVVMVPLIFLVTKLQTHVQQVSWIPIIPFAFIILAATTIVFCSAYIYLLYRKVVDDDASPA